MRRPGYSVGMARWLNRLRRSLRGRSQVLPTWYHPDYRLPLTSLAARTGLDPRRADFAAWHLIEVGVLNREELRVPTAIPWAALCAVHDAEYLERLTRPGPLADIFAVESWDLPVDEVIFTLRLSCGGTLAAARVALEERRPTLNLQGGMHHAGRDRGAGFCPVNDIAVAIVALRAGGFSGKVLVLDLDNHPPDGTADCLQDDPKAFIASLSGADWGPLPGAVDETVLPKGTGDDAYLEALEALLRRVPVTPLTFVVAGGDVRAVDPLSNLSLTEAGVQRRDLAVARFLAGRASVWLPGGGYGDQAWRVLAGTGMILADERLRPIPDKVDPLAERYARISRELRKEDLDGGPLLTQEDLDGMLGFSSREQVRLAGFYTRSGSEMALQRYGFTSALRRLGYDRVRVELDRAGAGDRSRVFARAVADPRPEAPEHLLVELVVEPREEAGLRVLLAHWLTLRHPLAAFTDDRPPLPGQEVPGLGMAREVAALLHVMASRLGLAGVAVRPAWYHVAYTSRHDFRFADGDREGRFRALARDLADLPLKAVTVAVAEGRVRLNGEPYAWEPSLMLSTPEAPGEAWQAQRDAALAASHFSLAPAAEGDATQESR